MDDEKLHRNAYNESYIRIAPFRYFSPHVYFSLSTVIFSSIRISSSREVWCVYVFVPYFVCMCVCVCVLLSFYRLACCFSSQTCFFFIFFSLVVVICRFIAADVRCCTCRLNILNVGISRLVLFWGGLNCWCTMSYYWFYMVTASIHADFSANIVRTHILRRSEE